MGMRSKTVRLDTQANAVATTDILTGRQGINRRLKGLYAQSPGDVFLLGLVEQTRIVEVGVNTAQFDQMMIPIERDLRPGETFSVGFEDFSGGGSNNQHITLFYEEDSEV